MFNKNIIIITFFLYILYFLFNIEIVNGQTLPDGFCPSPLIYRNSTNRELDTERGYQFVGPTNCVQPCPSIVFSEDNWNIFLNISLYCGGVSLFCSIFLIITYSPLVLPIKRQTRHTVSILFLFIGIFLMNTTNGRVFWDSDLKGFEKMCPEPGRFARGKHDPYCLATGIFYQFGCLTSMMWWSILSIDLYLTIKKIKVSKRQIYYYMAIVNSIAIVLTFIPIANNEYGQSSFSIGCWVMSLQYQVGAFWTWLAVCLTAGSICIGLIIREIYKTSGAAKKKLLARHSKPLILIILLLVHFFYMFIFVTNSLRNRGKYTELIKEYLTCILINAANPNRDDICKIKRPIPFGAQFTYFLFSRIMGFEGAIFYGFTNQTKKIWLKSYWLNNKLILQFRSSINFTTSSNSNTTNTTTNSATVVSKNINQDKDQHSYIDEENYDCNNNNNNSINNKTIELEEK